MVQVGEAPLDWKSMRTVGPGAMEIRIHRGGEFRVMYVTKFRDAVHVLHCFQKRTRKTDQGDIDIAKRRYAELMAVRKAERARP
jgi:phage-related protein